MTTFFSAETFGEELARLLDALYAIEQRGHSFNTSTEPYRGLFALPTGTSFYEADQLTRRFYLDPHELASEALLRDEGLSAQAFIARVRERLLQCWNEQQRGRRLAYAQL